MRDLGRQRQSQGCDQLLSFQSMFQGTRFKPKWDNRLQSFMSQSIDSNPTPSTNKLKNIWEQAIQKKKEEAEQYSKPPPKKQVILTVSSPVKIQPPISKPIERNSYQPLPLHPKLPQSTLSEKEKKTNQLSQGIQHGQQPIFVPKPITTVPVIQPSVNQQSKTQQDPATLSVKDRMKLWEGQKNPQLKQPPIQLKVPEEPQIKPPPPSQSFHPPAGPMFVIPNTSPEQPIPKINPSQQPKMASKTHIWEQIKRNQNDVPPEPTHISGFKNRMTYQPQTQSQINSISCNIAPKESEINLYDIIGPPSVIAQKENPPLVPNLQHKPVSSPTIQPPPMTIKQRMQMMKNTLQNNMKQKQTPHPVPTPIVAPSQPPAQQQPLEDPTQRPVRIKNKRKNIPNFDDI